MKLSSSFNKKNLVWASCVNSANGPVARHPGQVPIGAYFREDAQLGEEGYPPDLWEGWDHSAVRVLCTDASDALRTVCPNLQFF